jgi:hypothetical protein
MEVTIALCIGAIIGVITTRIYLELISMRGIMIVNQFDPEEELYTLKIDDLNNIVKKKYLNLTIKVDEERRDENAKQYTKNI